jgi:hypothetical protein
MQACLVFWDSIVLLPEHAVVRAANSTVDKRRKKEKDDDKVKLQAKAQREH